MRSWKNTLQNIYLKDVFSTIKRIIKLQQIKKETLEIVSAIQKKLH